MYCLPFTMYATPGELTPAPQLNFHSSLPVRASYALYQPFASPLNTMSPAVASTPPISGCGVLCFHMTLPLSRLTATSCPHCSSVGIVLNAPPSHSLLPPGYGASSTWYVIGWCRLAAYAMCSLGFTAIGDHSTPPF